MNARRIENAEWLKQRLCGYEFVSFPKYKNDRTCVYWFFPLMLSAAKAGFDMPDAEFRDKVSDALSAEGLRIGSWQRMPLPAQRLFKDKIGYGKGSPWSDGHYKGNVTYRVEDYPVAVEVSDRTTWLSNMYFWPSTTEDLEYAVKAFDKVFSQLDKIL